MRRTSRWNRILKTKFPESEEACRRADVVVTSSVMDVIDLVLGPLSVSVDGNVSSNSSLRHAAEVSNLGVKYDFLAEQLSSANLDCGTYRSLAGELADDIFKLRA